MDLQSMGSWGEGGERWEFVNTVYIQGGTFVEQLSASVPHKAFRLVRRQVLQVRGKLLEGYQGSSAVRPLVRRKVLQLDG
jgi:hypothetical protein